MNILARSAVIALACLPAFSLAQAGPPDPRLGPSTPVTVTNTPLPVTVGSEVNVSGSVTVTNTDANPVPIYGVVDVTQSKHPFQQRLTGGYGSGDRSWSGGTEPIEAGHRWVVEFLSLGYVIKSPTFTSIEACQIFIKQDVECSNPGGEGIVMRHTLPTTVGQDTFLRPDGLYVSAALAVKMYVEEGQRMCVYCALPPDNSVTSSGSLNVSGVLEPAQ